MIRRICYSFALLLSSLFHASAQKMPVNDAALSQQYRFVASVSNRIFNSGGLDSFYSKLALLKKDSNRVVSIVHIGDSHIQADFLSDRVRDGLQQFFGNAGRGLIFPYQLALSNAPDDIFSSSNIRWEYNRIAHPEIAITPGISGYGITTRVVNASVSISLQNDPVNGMQRFDRLRFFTDSNTWRFRPIGLDTAVVIDGFNRVVQMNGNASAFTLSSDSAVEKAFYGVSLEKSQPGVIYHTIGVNGARYDQYNLAELFWQQLPELKADLYIISLGTNEAQRAAFVSSAFEPEITRFIEKLRQSSPDASILITTPPDSYRNRRYANRVLRDFNQFLAAYCNKHRLPYWDLYRITNGHGSAHNWAQRGLMSRDRIHFTAAGYRLQGDLLLNALAKGYNAFIQE